MDLFLLFTPYSGAWPPFTMFAFDITQTKMLRKPRLFKT